MGRINKAIAEKVVKDLKEGVLRELLDEIKRDETLALEIRNEYISIYYRGGCISKLTYNQANNCYEDAFDNNYKNTNAQIQDDEDNSKSNIQNIIRTNEDCNKLVQEISERKRIMNTYFSNTPKREREYQQIVEWENNRDEHSNYTITDIEYQREKNSRFDMVAVQRNRQKDYQNLKMAVIELKYGIKSLKGQSGIYEHFTDVKSLTKEDIYEIIEDTEMTMNYKIDLGLIQPLESVKKGINIRKDSIDLIFFISDIAIDQSKTLVEEIQKINNDINSNEGLKDDSININVKVFSPYLAGNVMFDKDILSLDEFLKLNEIKEQMLIKNEN